MEETEECLKKALDEMQVKQREILDQNSDEYVSKVNLWDLLREWNIIMMHHLFEVMTKVRNRIHDNSNSIKIMKEELNYVEREIDDHRGGLQFYDREISQIRGDIERKEVIKHAYVKKVKNRVKENVFQKVSENYKNKEYSQEARKKNKCQDWKEQDGWHTKARCPKYGLHLCVHHTNPGRDGKKGFERGFTIVKDPRFKDDKGNNWPLRVELIPTKDKKRNTKCFMVAKNEFGQEEWYPKFYKRMRDKNLVYKDYQEILKINKDGVWKEHPMKINYMNGQLASIPLRFDLNKDQWKKVITSGSFKDMNISRRLGKSYKDEDIANSVIFKANNEGVFIIKPEDIRKYREENKPHDIFSRVEEDRIRNGNALIQN